ncbi:hypothetical protein WJX73_000527 [Symbiochloris irregularis]|uniref:RCC1-like domain-containing protein n=1 Tax=Symbiochloris irregularis TaxID=706552 RepID=A0AAW1NN00_9CHLO
MTARFGRVAVGRYEQNAVQPSKLDALRTAGEDASTCTVVGLACGSSHSVAVLANGTVLSWGRGEDGQLGHGDAEERVWPTAIFGLQGGEVTAVFCGAEYSAAVSTSTNSVFSWGWGDFGRLGHDDCQDLFVPKSIAGLAGRSVTTLACGDTHTCAVTDSGALLSFGRNQNGQLGLGTDDDALTPTLVSALEGHRITHVACGAEHTVACCEDGKAYSFGWGRYGNLGDGHRTDRWLPTRITQLEGKRIVTTACGWRHSIVLDDQGCLHTFGWSKYGQLGHGSLADQTLPKPVMDLDGVRITLVSGGWRHTVAADDTGCLYAWGWNKFGQLGSGSTVQIETRPVLIQPKFSDGQIIALACGWRHTLVADSLGQVFGWGRGVNGQLGCGNHTNHMKPVLLECLSAGTMDADALLATASPESSFVPASDRYAVVPGRAPADTTSAAMAVPEFKKARLDSVCQDR